MTPIILFDGNCATCHAAVRLVLRRDRAGVFRFARQDGSVGRRLLEEHRVAVEAGRTLVLIEGGRAWVRSEAVLRIARRLRGVARLAAVAGVVPRAWRDALYDLVARHRRRLPPGAPRCDVLTRAERSRFLDPEPVR